MQEMQQEITPPTQQKTQSSPNYKKMILGLVLLIVIVASVWFGVSKRIELASPNFIPTTDSQTKAAAEPFVPNQFTDSNAGIPVPVGTCGRGMQIEFTQGTMVRLMGKSQPAQVEICQLEVDVSTPYGMQTYACNFVTAVADTIYLQSDYLGFDRDFMAQHCDIKQ